MAIKQKIAINRKQTDLETFDTFEVSPDLYTHLIIIEALKAIPKGLESNNFENGFVALTVTVDQLEQILRARKLLDEESDYYTKVKEKERALQEEGLRDTMYSAKMANFKLGELMGLAFSSTAQEGELTL